MTRVLALADQSKIGSTPQRRFATAGTETLRNGVPLWTETACRFHPKPPAGLNRNRLSETPKFALAGADGQRVSSAAFPKCEFSGISHNNISMEDSAKVALLASCIALMH